MRDRKRQTTTGVLPATIFHKPAKVFMAHGRITKRTQSDSIRHVTGAPHADGIPVRDVKISRRHRVAAPRNWAFLLELISGRALPHGTTETCYCWLPLRGFAIASGGALERCWQAREVNAQEFPGALALQHRSRRAQRHLGPGGPTPRGATSAWSNCLKICGQVGRRLPI